MIKTVPFSSFPEEDLRNIERLYYETNGKERILAIALSTSFANGGIFNDYEKDYFETYKEYEAEKSKFYEKFILPIQESATSWELDFFNKVLKLVCP